MSSFFSRSNRRRGPQRLTLEALEHRQLLSVAPLMPSAPEMPPMPECTTCIETGGLWNAFQQQMSQDDSGTETPNSTPVAQDDAYAIRSNQQLGASVLANDSDIEGDALSVSLVEGPSHGTLSLGADGRFTYSPNLDFGGEDQFIYQVSDGQSTSTPATVRIGVTSAVPANVAPTASEDSYSVLEGEALTVNASGVLANDSDPDGDPLSAVLVSAPENGTLVLGTDGSFQYTPNAGFRGTDTFSYSADDGQAQSQVASVTIDVTGANAAPSAADDAYAVDQDSVLTVTEGGTLANDSDPDGDPLSASLVEGPSNGTLLLNADGTFEYTPNAGFVGTDTFTYLANDGQADSESATVTITVNRINTSPAAADDSYSVAADQILSVEPDGVLANDADPESDPLSAVLVEGPTNGTLALNADGSFEYKPAAGFVGTDTFTYLANDGRADSNVATVSITVEATNQAPIATGDSYAVAPGATLTVDDGGVLANDSDPDGDPLTARLVEGPSHGSVTLGEDGSFEYTPEADFRGTDRFTYVASDGTSDSEAAEVVISVEQTTMGIHLEVSDTAFGQSVGDSYAGSTFWVNVYVEDLRDVPLGVVGGAVDLMFDSLGLTPTGNVAYGDSFTAFQQGTADDAAGVIDETGALATSAGVGANGPAAFVAWEFRRDGVGAPNDANSHVEFSVSPAQGTGTMLPADFALVGEGSAVDWSDIELQAADVDLILGDFNADGAVNQFDLALWLPQASTSAGSEGYQSRFDLTADNLVDEADLAILLARMYQPTMPESSETPVPSEESSSPIETSLADSMLASQVDEEDERDSNLTEIDRALGDQDPWDIV